MARLDGSKVLITGGTSGIGLATAKLFQREGARVAVTGRTKENLAQARASLNEDTLVIESDTSRIADIDALASKLRTTFGSLDTIFVNAGIARFVPLSDVSEASFDEVFSINVRGAFFLIQRLAPLIRNGGSIIVNTSVVDQKGYAATSVYSASKAALRSLARTLSTELLPRGIRVNAVSPGPIETPIFDRLDLPAEARDAFATQIRELNPMKRFGRPEEVAEAVLFLAHGATYTTGAEIVVDGGVSQL